MGYAQEYASAVMWRGRVPMEPTDFTPDWGDAPRRSRYFPGTDRLPLPPGQVPATATVGTGILGAQDRTDPGGDPHTGGTPHRFTLPALSGMLLDSYATIGRRLGIQANTDLKALPSYAHANWFRGTASGGGLYPCAVYWASGPGGPLTPGIYHYSTGHHALSPLLTGDVTGIVRAALGHLPAARTTDQFLLVTVKMWQNSFKYNSFAYHAVTMDVGTMVQTWRIWARAQGLRVDPVLWFDEQPLNDLLGLSAEAEGVFAVVPLDWDTPTAPSAPGWSPVGGDGREPGGAGDTSGTRTAAGSPAPAVRHRDRERSVRHLTFEPVLRMRRATLGYAEARPATGALDIAAGVPSATGADGRRLALPGPRPLTMDVRTALRRRRSSFGRFEARVPIEMDQLAALLAASAAGRFDSDAAGADAPSLLKLYAFVNHVRGVPPAAYEYDPDSNELLLADPGAPGDFLQRNYFLANYNLEQAATVLVPTIRTRAVLEVTGDRGYHLVNAIVGAVAQNCYTAASALDLGCGVALGFDNISYIEKLGLADSGEYPLLIMLVGHERPDPADFRYELV